MLTDILAIIKNSALFIGSFYGYLKLSRIKLRLINLLDIIAAVLLGAGLYFATKQIRILLPIGYLLLTCLYCLLRYRRPALNTFTIGVISCGITIIILAVAVTVSIPLEYLVFKYITNETALNCVSLAVICILILIALILIYRVKRFKSGISVQNNDGSVELLLLISILSVFLFTLFYATDVASSPFEIIVLSIILCGLGFIVLWKKHITSSYNKKIQIRNEDLYEQRIKEYEKERGELLNQNAELSKIIHRDNKLIPALAEAVKKIIASAPNKKDYKDLLAQIEQLSAERKEVIAEYQAKADTLPKTENTALDAVIHYLHNKALQNGILAEFNVDNAAIPLLLDCVKDHTDLNTILCDLGENAIIAAKHVQSGKIRISFEADGNAPSISFYDNGDKFDEKVLANMGKRRITTHKSEGGSGIGLMTLFEILNKYNASYCLDEHLSDGTYTKQIKLTFDNLHNISILTLRENN